MAAKQKVQYTFAQDSIKNMFTSLRDDTNSDKKLGGQAKKVFNEAVEKETVDLLQSYEFADGSSLRPSYLFEDYIKSKLNLQPELYLQLPAIWAEGSVECLSFIHKGVKKLIDKRMEPYLADDALKKAIRKNNESSLNQLIEHTCKFVFFRLFDLLC